MPEQLEEALRDATADLRVQWAPPQELRRRAVRRRTRLVASAALLSALALAGVGRFTAVHVMGLPDPAASPTCSNVDSWPVSEHEVRVNVYDAAASAGLAQEVASALRIRNFQVAPVVPYHVRLADDAVALVRFSPAEADKATLLLAYLSDEALSERDASRDDGIVDLLVGPRFDTRTMPAGVDLDLERDRPC